MEESRIEEKSAHAAEEYDEFGYTQIQPADFDYGVPEPLRMSAWIVVLTELCERFTYYGASIMFTTYMREKLGVAKASSVSINRGFTFLAYASTLIGGYLSDQYLGKYKTICLFGVWYFIGTVLLTISALTSLSKSTGLAIFIVGTYLFMGIGTGGIKANVSTFVAEQARIGYRPTNIPGAYYDSRLTVERTYRYFYMAINIGAFVGMLVCPTVSKKRGYNAAFAIPTALMGLCLIVFIPSYKLYNHKRPSGSLFGKIYRTMKYAKQHKSVGNAHWLDGAKGLKDAEWNDTFVEGLKRSIRACKVFLFYPFYWALYNNMSDNFINQGMQMRRPGWLEASQLNVVNSLVLVVAIPIFDSWLFPLLARKKIHMGPIKRILIGFGIVVTGFIYVTILQKVLYRTGPHYNFTGPDVTEDSFNNISVWWQIPAYVSIGISEIFASITGLEYAFSQAPSELKSVLQALFLFTNAGGSLIGLILSIWSGDPTVFYTFIAQTVMLAVIAVIFYFCFNHYDVMVRAQETYE